VLENNIDGSACQGLAIAKSVRLGWQLGLFRIAQHLQNLFLRDASFSHAREGVLVKGNGLAPENLLIDDSGNGIA
jgi:hypothetical protein